VLEIVKFTPKLTVLKYVGDKENRCNLRMKIREHVARQSSTMNVSKLYYRVCSLNMEFWITFIKKQCSDNQILLWKL